MKKKELEETLKIILSQFETKEEKLKHAIYILYWEKIIDEKALTILNNIMYDEL